MSDLDSNLLKFDMQLTAKKLKLRNKTTNILLRDATSSNTFSKSTPTKSDFSCPKKASKENRNKMFEFHGRYSKKKNIRRPVNYTWNRGGRLKEIRIRTQARKFLYLWIRKTFGKMTYSQVQQYYFTKILSKCFQSWKSCWWENCGEMKMFIRAEYFNRYQLYSKIWIAWKLYIEARRKKKALCSKVFCHYSYHTTRKYMNLWMIYVQLRKTKKDFYTRAYDIASFSLMKKTWQRWCLALDQRRLYMQNCQYAISHCSGTILKKVWETWCSHYAAVVRMKQLSQMANKKMVFSMSKKYFFYWRDYVHSRCRKNTLYDKARRLYNLSLKHNTLCIWWTRYGKALEYRDRLYNCQVRGTRAIKRRYFSAWTVYVNIRIDQRRQQAVAQIYHRRFLLRSSFECLRNCVVLKIRKYRMHYTAQKYYALSLLKSVWCIWSSRMESIEETELDDLTSVARDHYGSKLIRKAFLALVSYKDWRRSRKKSIMKAETHFIVKAFPRFFNHWRRYVDEVKDVNEMKKDADNFRKELLSTKYFYTWYSAFEEAQENRTKERMAVMMFTENTLRRHCVLWRLKTGIILLSNRNDAVARVHYRRSLLHFGINRWIQYTKDSLLRKRKLCQADSYYHESLRAEAWLAWKKYAIRCRQKKEKINRALEHNKKCLLQKSLASWMLEWNKAKAIQRHAEQKYETICLQALQKSFLEWQKNAAANALKRELRRKALCHRHHHLQSLALTRWRQWMIVRRFKNEQKQETLIRVVKVLDKYKLQRCFHFWRETRHVVQSQNFQLTRAQQHYYSRISKVVFQAWQIFSYIMLKKNLMQRQGDVLRRNRILLKHTEKWKNALRRKYDEAAKTGDALWHWAVVLQGRCFDNWRNYIAERKRKKKRYDKAMDARRYHLIKSGCAQMLQFHANALAQRTQYEACQQAKASYTAYHLAWKYGKRWINKVREKTASSQQLDQSSTDSFITEKFSCFSNLKPWLPIPSPIVKERLSATNFFRSSKNCYQLRESTQKQRPPPRLPDFLDDSLRREGIFDEYLANEIRTSELSPRPVRSCEIPLVGRYGDPSEGEVTTTASTSTATPVLSISVTSESLPLEPTSCAFYEETQKCQNFHNNYSPVRPSNFQNSTCSVSSSGIVLMPPSAFSMPDNKPVSSSSSLLSKSCETERSASSSNTLDATSNRQGCSLDEKKDPFKTFIASPSSTRQELKIIYQKLKEFQELRDQLKLLKQQKEVLKNWIDENLSTMSTSKSLDMVTVQEEISEIDRQCARISEELLVKRPEVESLAVRVRVLCARPT